MYVIIVLILFLLFFVVYTHYLRVYDERLDQQGHREIKAAYKRVIKREFLSISAMDRFGNRLIAIDRVLGKLVLIVNKDGVTFEKCFNMEEILLCRVIKTFDKPGGGIQNLTLELMFRSSIGIVNFQFFDEKIDNKRDLHKRLKKSQYWKREIQIQLSRRQIDDFNHKEQFYLSGI